VSTSSQIFGRFLWRSDGNAIRAQKRTIGPSGQGITVVEILLSGPDRLLRDISAEFPDVTGIVFTSDRAVVARVAKGPSIERFFIPLDGGAAHRLPDSGTEPGLRQGGVGLVAGNRILSAQVNERGEAEAITIASTVDDSASTLRLPFSNPHSNVFPDGKQIISIGKAAGESAYKLFIVPVDGKAPRLIGEIPYDPSSSGDRPLAPSPDGKLLAYTSPGRYTTKIYEIDFNPAMQAIIKR
jgi:hypothetical protein